MLHGVAECVLEGALGVTEETLGELDVGHRQRDPHEVGEVAAALERADRLGVPVPGQREIAAGPVGETEQRSRRTTLERLAVAGQIEHTGRVQDRSLGVAGEEGQPGAVDRDHGRKAGVGVVVGNDRRLVRGRAEIGPGRAGLRLPSGRRWPCGLRPGCWRARDGRRRPLPAGTRARSSAVPPGGPAASPARRARSGRRPGPGPRRPGPGRWLRRVRRCRRTSRSLGGAARVPGRRGRRRASPAGRRRRGGGIGTRCGGRRARRGRGSSVRAPRGWTWRRRAR